ncbi:hypothetical protein EYF80_061383 [Liparis tanakae]|uniref:Uncharacterized protein n=1 Tax=Liparis tanakae TaxID=230148 RepID=A0A4Z2EI49_9TELE|nr:hypothetical protein EYF80_061383 [Liparis tanakae]
MPLKQWLQLFWQFSPYVPLGQRTSHLPRGRAGHASWQPSPKKPLEQTWSQRVPFQPRSQVMQRPSVTLQGCWPLQCPHLRNPAGHGSLQNLPRYPGVQRSHRGPHSVSRHWQRPVNWSHGELLQLHWVAQFLPVQPGLHMQRPVLALHSELMLQ